MIKSELIAAMTARFSHLPEHHVAESINLLFERMSRTLSEGGRVEIRGFGNFSLHYRPPRNAHNPKTGERVITQGKYSPHFKTGKQLRDNINAQAKAGVKIQEMKDNGTS